MAAPGFNKRGVASGELELKSGRRNRSRSERAPAISAPAMRRTWRPRPGRERRFRGREKVRPGYGPFLASVLRKARFWGLHGGKSLNERQKKVLNQLLDGFEGKLTSSKWANLTKCSQDTAHRDIVLLLEHGILAKDAAGGRSTSYSLIEPGGRISTRQRDRVGC